MGLGFTSEKEKPAKKPAKKSAYQEQLEAKYPEDVFTEEEARSLYEELVRANVNIEKLMAQYKVKDIRELTPAQAIDIYGKLGSAKC